MRDGDIGARLNRAASDLRPRLLTLDRLTPNYLMTYSSTDAGVVTRIVGAEVLEHPASCGRPVPGTTVEIRDGDRL